MSTSAAAPGRRRFLKTAALGAAAFGAALTLPPALRADPYAPFARPARPGKPVRVRGQVRADGRGVAGVGVTDGLSYVDTAADGTFELISRADRPFVYLTLPAGYAIPQQAAGTARLFQPLAPDARGEATARFDLTRSEVPDADHAFLVLADPQTQNAYEMGLLHAETVPDVRRTVQAMDLPVAFGVSCGDIMFDDLSLYPEYERAVARMELPFFQVIGNHDLDFEGATDAASARTFRSHFGPTYYAFDRGLVHYVVLDDVFWSGQEYFGYLDDDQLGWLAQDLARVEAGRPVVVFLHIPALGTRFRRYGEREPAPGGAVANREALYRLLEPYQAHLMSGHTHEHEHVFEGGTHEHIHGTVCGAWWSGPICYDGTPGGYGTYEVRGETLRWRYKPTGLDADHQLRVYPRGADPTAPHEIVANVWDWDPAWRVVWYEDGLRKGRMARRTGTDPLSESLHRGTALPERRPWVDPLRTGHLFYAPVAPEAREVRVEVTDRWGHVFSARV